MATLEKIRNRAGALVAVVIGLALFAFILGDILGSGPSLFTNRQFEIADIAGKSISYETFQFEVDELSEIYRLNTGESSLDAETYEGILDQAWQLLLRKIIMEQEYEKLGIEVSPEELFDMVQGSNIHPIVRQLFTDPNTGSFDRSAVIRFLRTMNQDPTGQQLAYWLYVEREITRERMFNKYTNLISKGLYVTPLQARNAWENNNKRVDFDFIIQRFNTVHDSLVEISTSDIRRYYRQNRSDFSQTASRDVEYIAFDIEPSEDDDRMAQEWIESMEEEFRQVEEVRPFINLNSDIPYERRNYGYEDLPESIADFMFSAEPGDIYGPYFEDNSYRLSRLVEINFIPDSVRARHILIQPTEELNYSQARGKADSLVEVARSGVNFEMMALEHSDDTGSRFEGGNLGWFQEGAMVPEFNDAVFAAQQGEIFMVETQFGFHIVQVTARSAQRKKIRYATLAREVTPSSTTYQRVFSQASRFAGENNTYQRFVDAAAEQNLTLRVADNILINDKQLPGLENARELVRWAFDSREKSISPILEINNKFIVAALTTVREDGYQSLDEVTEEIRSILTREKKGKIIASRLESKIEEGHDLGSIAESLNTSVEQASNITFSSFSVPVAGIEPRLIAAAVTLEENRLSPPVTGENGVYLLKVTSVTIPDEMDLDMERTRLINIMRSRANFESFEALRKEANIKDNRHKFF